MLFDPPVEHKSNIKKVLLGPSKPLVDHGELHCTVWATGGST